MVAKTVDFARRGLDFATRGLDLITVGFAFAEQRTVAHTLSDNPPNKHVFFSETLHFVGPNAILSGVSFYALGVKI